MSTSFYDVTKPNTSYTVDDAIFEVESGASLNLTGSSDNVILASGAGQVSISGSGNSIFGPNVGNANAQVFGSDNNISVGVGSLVVDYGYGDTITAGDNSQLYLMGKSTINANSNSIKTGNSFDSGELNGSGNQITIGAGGSIDLNGTSNAVSANGGVGPNWSITTGTTSSLAEVDGAVVLTGNAKVASSLSDGVLAVQLDNGNVTTLSNVASGTKIEVIDATGHATVTTLFDTDLIPEGGDMYAIKGSGQVQMDNVTLEVLSGSSLNLRGSSDTVFLDTGAKSVTLTGSNNRMLGTAANNVNVSVNSESENNSISVGTGSQVIDYGDGDTITTGTNSYVFLMGRSTVNANNSRVQGGNSFSAGTIKGNGNQITINSGGWPSTLSLNGSNNTISGTTNESIAISGANNTLTFSGGDNSVSFSASNGAQTISNAAGVMLYELADGEIYWNQPATLSLNGGVASLGFGDGTQITISNVRSSTGVTDLGATDKVNQLVSAMASYSATAPGVSSQLSAQATQEPALFASTHH